MLLNGGVFRGPFSACYIWLRSRVGSLIRVLIPGAVLTDGRATAQVCDSWFLITAVWEAGFRWLMSILGEDDQTAVWPFSLTGAAGYEAPIVVLWGVDHAEVIARVPCCGALIKDGCFPGGAPASFLLFQLSYFLKATDYYNEGENMDFSSLKFCLTTLWEASCCSSCCVSSLMVLR